MTGAAFLRVGWCPGALRPMPAGDGLLVRVKPRGCRVAIPVCRALAALSRRYGNGIITLTGRANLQLRGVRESDLAALTDALAGLGLLDQTAEGEAARNLVSSPLAGVDRSALLDIRPAVAALETALASEPPFWRLPAKFAWTVDDGSALGLGSVAADVAFLAVSSPLGPRFAVRLGGDDRRVASCAVDDMVETARSLAACFLDLCAEQGITPHRMRDLTGTSGAEQMLTRAGLQSGMASAGSAAEASSIGLRSDGAQSCIGVAPPFGRLEAHDLDRFAVLAGRAGAADIHFTPWRTMLAAPLRHGEASGLRAALAAAPAGLIVDPADPRLAVAACSGAPACIRASVRVQDDAGRLAPLLAAYRLPGIALHVSGCAKGCAHGRPAPVTLVGREGRYDVVRDGKPSDAPVLRGVALEALPGALASQLHFGQDAAANMRVPPLREPVC